jgi:5-oxoprolinase (ATP-hydrolysing)
MQSWDFWIDRGGTFTDIIARRPDGSLLTAKRLSGSADGSDAAIAGIKEILEKEGAGLADLGSLRMGTTTGTNALLERNGARTVLVVTKGFADAVKIGYQQRPQLFALEIVLPRMLYEEVVEFEERLSAGGQVLLKADPDRLRQDLERAYAAGIRSCAIALLHAYRYPAHELLAAEIAKSVGFEQISLSHDCASLMKFVARTDTTLVDAYLTPLLRNYISGLKKELGTARLAFMQSNGGLADASMFRGKDCILSGPAGGLVGAIKAAESCGFGELITFDMGGTSTDVSHFASELEHIYDTEISGMRIRAPMLDIHTVAAGGGSILGFDGCRCLVGPDSAGANPGPLSYRRCGPLTLTDANLLLGRIQSDYFPKIFGAGASESLDLPSVREAFACLSRRMQEATGQWRRPEEVALGFVKIAVAKMANAIKHVSVQRGHDTRQCLLVCFGGAGGQHACAIAEELGIRSILIHPLAGVLSAYGIGLAETRLTRDLDINQTLDTLDPGRLQEMILSCKKEMCSLLAEKGVRLAEQETRVTAFIAMEGSDYSLGVPFADVTLIAQTFNKKHLARYGFTDENRKLVLVSLSVQLVGHDASGCNLQLPAAGHPEAMRQVTARLFTGSWRDCPLVERKDILPGQKIEGPAVISEENTTTVVDAGWQARMLADGSLLLTLSGEADFACSAAEVGGRPRVDPVTLELFNNLFGFVASQMGITLQNTSQSVNIKERLDFSCALFDAGGNLVANAPHIPVHLGSMGESVKSLIAAKGDQMRPGDAYATNDPYNGGTHLPDITVVSPAFDAGGKELLFFVASRGHHADIGGITPGSMPADSRSIEEEGALFRHLLVMREGRVFDDEIQAQLLCGKYPARKPVQNLADLKAQIAANASGIRQMQEIIEKWGSAAVLAYMGYVQDNAEECLRRVIKTLSSGSFACSLDDGSTIKVQITVDRDRAQAEIDFSGTSAQTATNFNAPLAVCKAAVLYVFRTLVPDEIPLNAGCFRPLKIVVPEGCLLNPVYPAPVVAGNVETSQVIVDVLYGALGVMAACQGTMNNLSFGNQRYQYYETICGGTGAGAGFAGAGPVHANMTNSRLTDPEVLEAQFPVLVESFAVRSGSGGPGKFAGGNGAVRRIRFLEKMTAAILSNRRNTRPYGLAGGGAGLPGRNYIQHLDGSISQLSYRASFSLEPGEILTIETPGGGGYGE